MGSKEKKTLEGISGHMDLVVSCCRELVKAYEVYLRDDEERFAQEAEEMRRIEKEADEARRQVELSIYSGAFVPIHREDYLNLAETIDRVADSSVAVANLLQLTSVRIPGDAEKPISEMINQSLAAVETLSKCVSVAMKHRKKAGAVAREVEVLEEEIDDLEFKLRSSLYRMEIDGYDKIILNELVEKIGDISDSAEDASDLVVILISKRR